MSDKTEKATPKRKKETRDKGQVAKSQDLTGAAVMLAGLMTLGIVGPKMIARLQGQLVENISEMAHPELVDAKGLPALLGKAGMTFLMTLGPVLAVCTITAIVVTAAQVGLKLTPKAIKPDFKKLNPLKNAKNVFGPNALFELAKNLVKVSVVGGVVYMIVAPQVKSAGTLVGLQPAEIGGLLMHSITRMARFAGAAYLLIGVVDFVWQRHRTDKSMKMEKKEVREEAKSFEVPPEVRMALRRRAMELSRARMMADVPDADVVVTNPTHYAVALKYSPDDGAPQVVAKGKDVVAFKIREVAEANGVPVIPDPPLARSLHAGVEIGQFIPEELYEAVAQVLAFVFRTRAQQAGLRGAA